jgi:hypothetical protein
LQTPVNGDGGLLFGDKLRLRRRASFGLFTFSFDCFGGIVFCNRSGFCLGFLLDVCFYFDSPLLLHRYLISDVFQCRLDDGNDGIGADTRQLVQSFWRII